MLNKEEIEDIKDNLRTLHKVLWDEHKEGTYTIERILEYINCLEQKESILNKVTEFIKDDVTAEDIKFEGSKTVHFIYKNLINITKEKIAEGINSYKDQIEDIIEGGTNNGK